MCKSYECRECGAVNRIKVELASVPQNQANQANQVQTIRIESVPLTEAQIRAINDAFRHQGSLNLEIK